MYAIDCSSKARESTLIEMTTLKEIAEAVGCSSATVSRALNGDLRISAQRREQVNNEAIRLGYQANQLARSLRRQKIGYVGVIIPNLTNSYYTYCLAHLTDRLTARGLHAVLGCHNFDASLDATLIQSLINREVDGLLHVPCTKEGIEGVLKTIDIPVIEIVQRSASRGVDAVYVDNAKGIAEIVRYLHGLGHRRIVMIAGRREVLGVDAQARGFLGAVKEIGLSTSTCTIEHLPANRHDCSDRIELCLDGPAELRPTAIIAAHYFAVTAALSVFRVRGMQLPDDISLVAFSNDDWFDVSSPPVTTFEHPFRSMSNVATQLLLTRLQPHPDHPSKPEFIEFDGRMLERVSAGPPAVS